MLLLGRFGGEPTSFLVLGRLPVSFQLVVRQRAVELDLGALGIGKRCFYRGFVQGEGFEVQVGRFFTPVRVDGDLTGRVAVAIARKPEFALPGSRTNEGALPRTQQGGGLAGRFAAGTGGLGRHLGGGQQDEAKNECQRQQCFAEAGVVFHGTSCKGFVGEKMRMAGERLQEPEQVERKSMPGKSLT